MLQLRAQQVFEGLGGDGRVLFCKKYLRKSSNGKIFLFTCYSSLKPIKHHMTQRITFMFD